MFFHSTFNIMFAFAVILLLTFYSYCDELNDRFTPADYNCNFEGDVNSKGLCECYEQYFTGRSCQNMHLYCSKKICGNNGLCINHVGSFSCMCLNGFYGKRCSKSDDMAPFLPNARLIFNHIAYPHEKTDFFIIFDTVDPKKTITVEVTESSKRSLIIQHELPSSRILYDITKNLRETIGDKVHYGNLIPEAPAYYYKAMFKFEKVGAYKITMTLSLGGKIFLNDRYTIRVKEKNGACRPVLAIRKCSTENINRSILHGNIMNKLRPRVLKSCGRNSKIQYNWIVKKHSEDVHFSHRRVLGFEPYTLESGDVDVELDITESDDRGRYGNTNVKCFFKVPEPRIIARANVSDGLFVNAKIGIILSGNDTFDEYFLYKSRPSRNFEYQWVCNHSSIFESDRSDISIPPFSPLSTVACQLSVKFENDQLNTWFQRDIVLHSQSEDEESAAWTIRCSKNCNARVNRDAILELEAICINNCLQQDDVSFIWRYESNMRMVADWQTQLQIRGNLLRILPGTLIPGDDIKFILVDSDKDKTVSYIKLEVSPFIKGVKCDVSPIEVFEYRSMHRIRCYGHEHADGVFAYKLYQKEQNILLGSSTADQLELTNVHFSSGRTKTKRETLKQFDIELSLIAIDSNGQATSFDFSVQVKPFPWANYTVETAPGFVNSRYKDAFTLEDRVEAGDEGAISLMVSLVDIYLNMPDLRVNKYCSATDERVKQIDLVKFKNNLITEVLQVLLKFQSINDSQESTATMLRWILSVAAKEFLLKKNIQLLIDIITGILSSLSHIAPVKNIYGDYTTTHVSKVLNILLTIVSDLWRFDPINFTRDRKNYSHEFQRGISDNMEQYIIKSLYHVLRRFGKIISKQKLEVHWTSQAVQVFTQRDFRNYMKNLEIYKVYELGNIVVSEVVQNYRHHNDLGNVFAVLKKNDFRWSEKILVTSILFAWRGNDENAHGNDKRILEERELKEDIKNVVISFKVPENYISNSSQIIRESIFLPPLTLPDADLKQYTHYYKVATRTNVAIVVQFQECQDDRLFQVTMSRKHRPTSSDPSALITPSSATVTYVCPDDMHPFVYIAIHPHVETSTGAQPFPRSKFDYAFTVDYVECLAWNLGTFNWTAEETCQFHYQDNGLTDDKNVQNPYPLSIQCRCETANGIYAAARQSARPTLETKIDFRFIPFNYTDNDLMYYLQTILLILLRFSLFLLYGWYRDMMFDKQNTVKILRDNNVVDKHPYLLRVKTGSKAKSGTTSNIGIQLSGDENSSMPHKLRGDSPQVFRNGKYDWFLMTTPACLGELSYLRIWNDGTGDTPTWYCYTVEVCDLHNQREWIFYIDSWMSVMERPKEKSFYNAKPARHRKYKNNAIFWTNVLDVVRNHDIYLGPLLPPERDGLSNTERSVKNVAVLSLLAPISLIMIMQVESKFWVYDDVTGQIPNAIICNVIGVVFNIILTVLLMRTHPSTEALATTRSARVLCPEIGECCGMVLRTVYEVPATMVLRPAARLHDPIRRNLRPPLLRIVSIMLILFSWTFCAIVLIYYGVTGITRVRVEEWVDSILMQTIIAVLPVEPIKIIIMALIITKWPSRRPRRNFVISVSTLKLPKNVDFDEADHIAENIRRTDKLFQNPSKMDKLKRYEWEKYRSSHTWKKKKLIIYLPLLVFLYIMSSMSRSSQVYYSTISVRTMFEAGRYTEGPESSSVLSITDFYHYLEKTVIQSLYWSVAKDNEGVIWTADKAFILLGRAKLRQHRMRRESCKKPAIMDKLPEVICLPGNEKVLDYDCVAVYSKSMLEKGSFDVGWKEAKTEDDGKVNEARKPYTYQPGDSMFEVARGNHAWYSGGGHTAALGRSRGESVRLLGDLKRSNWVDNRTRAVITEFTLYNVDSNIFNIVQIIAEKMATGEYDVSIDEFPTRLLYSGKQLPLWTMSLPISAILFYIIMHQTIVITMSSTLKEYFSSLWNWVDLLMILFGVISVVFLAIRYFLIIRTMDTFRNPNTRDDANFNTVAGVDYLFNIFSSFFILFSIFQCWSLFLFNLRFRLVNRNLIANLKTFGVYIFILILFLVSFASLGFGLMGDTVDAFKSLYSSVITLMSLSFGFSRVGFYDIKEKVGVAGDVFYTLFAFCVRIYLVNIFISVMMSNYNNVKASQEEMKEQSTSSYRSKKMTNIKSRLMDSFRKTKLKRSMQVETIREDDNEVNLPFTPISEHTDSTQTAKDIDRKINYLYILLKNAEKP